MRMNPDTKLLAVLLTLYFLVGVLLFTHKAHAQDVITCTDGTHVFQIRTPGMCPPGSWQI